MLIVASDDLIGAIPRGRHVGRGGGQFHSTSMHVRSLRWTPKSETAVMVGTAAIVGYAHNLAYGVVAGVLLLAIFLARREARLAEVTR